MRHRGGGRRSERRLGRILQISCRSGERSVEARELLGAKLRCDVPIGCGELRVSKHVADEHRIRGAGDDASRGVAEPVQLDRAESGRFTPLLVAPAERRAVQAPAPHVGEHVVVRLEELASAPEPAQRFDCRPCQRHDAGATALGEPFDVGG